MSIESQIVGESGDAAEVRRGNFNGRPFGVVAHTTELYDWKQRSILFTDDDGSRNINIDASFGGTPDGVHNGTDAVEWTAAATVGTWDFASTIQSHSGTKSIRANNMSNGDIATISKGSSLDFSAYTAFSGWIYIERFQDTTQQIWATFTLSSITIGNSVNISDYIDGSTSGAWQKFVIPKSDLGITDVDVDALVIEFVVSSGKAPRVYFDDMQIEETGGKVFTASPNIDKVFQYNAIEFYFADAIASTLASGTMHNLAYDQILGVTALSSGIGLQRFENGKPQVTVIMRNLSEMLSSTFDIINVGSDGTNTFLKLRVKLPVWITLDGKERDRVQLSISDDLSGLLEFKAILIGRELIEYEGK